MRIFVLLASLFNGYVIGSIVALLAKRFWGDNPKGRFAEVIGGLGSGIFYSVYIIGCQIVLMDLC